MHPDGKRVYVTSGGEGTVQVIDTATNTIVATIPVGKRPWNMALTPDGTKLYVACGRSNAVAVVDTRPTPRSPTSPSASCPGAWPSADPAAPATRRVMRHRTGAGTPHRAHVSATLGRMTCTPAAGAMR